MKKLKMVLVVFAMVLLVGCREDEPEVKASTSLYLKAAELNERTYVDWSEVRDAKYYYPKNVLFQISKDSVKVINNSRITVKSFKYLADSQIEFSIIDNDNLDLKSVCAKKIPIFDYDYGRQSEEGDNRFNGILKVDNYVFAVNMSKGDVKVVDLNTGKTFTTKGSIHVNALFFKIENKIWQMWISKITPVGNVFQGMTDGKQFLCHTLSL